MNKSRNISVVIPIHNEESNIDELIVRTGNVLNEIGGNNEIICVDDGSKDASIEKLLKYKHIYPVRILRFNKRMGQSAALAAGFINARGELIAMLDADLQCKPEDLPVLLDQKSLDIDAVCGIRRKRNDAIIKKTSSFIGNSFRNAMTGEDVSDTGCPLKIFDSAAIRAIPYFNGFHRFIPTLLKIKGYSVKQVPVNHYPRKKGISKYNIKNRLFKGLIDVIAIIWIKKNNFLFKNNMEEL
jgi:glycosyltransferase involved in cell wall biosynthesis